MKTLELISEITKYSSFGLIAIVIFFNSLYAIQVFNFTGTIDWLIEWKYLDTAIMFSTLHVIFKKCI